jgi:hypothetical protein
MDFNSTIDLIVKDLDDARNIIDDLKKYPGVPVLQVELAKSKCKSAGEVISLLKELMENVTPTKKDSEEKPVEQKIVPHIEIAEDEKITDIPVSTDQPVEEKKSEILPVEITPSPVKEKEDAKDKPKKQAESSIIADKFSHMSNRFNEQLDSRKSEEDVSEILKTKPITNLSKAIGINDKFLFIREIFNGNEKAYSQVIIKLEEINSLSEAREIIMSSSDSDKENKVIEQLLNLVKRKLLPHE